MANQTVSTNINFDDASISGLANGDSITINTNSTLTINSDVRWGQQAAVIGAITIDAATGGTLLIEGRQVWWIPFDSSSGNVPALGTVGTEDVSAGGSNVGEFLGVWTALATAPLSAGSIMPPSGFIKLRRKTAAINDNDILTFAGGGTVTVDSISGGQRGWIHVVGKEATAITVPRLGELEAAGDWFLLGETSGADDQTFQYPVPDNCPCFFMEDMSGGYDIWLNAGSRWGAATATVATDARGKFFGCDNTTGILTIARRVSNNCGYKPASGRKVYIPNIIISNSTATDWSVNTINATPATRWDFNFGGAGKIKLRKCTGTWYFYIQYAYAVDVADCGFLHPVIIDTIATTVSADRCGLGVDGSSSTATPLSLFNLDNVTFSRCVNMRYSVATDAQVYVVRLDNCKNVTFNSCISYSFGDTTSDLHTSGVVWGLSAVNSQTVSFDNCACVGCHFNAVSSSDVLITNTQYADCMRGTTQTTKPFTAAIVLGTAVTGVIVDGFSNFAGLTDVHPYTAIIHHSGGANNNLIRNIGSPDVEYDCGSSNAVGYVINTGSSSDLTVRRVYTKNVRSNVLASNGSMRNLTIENLWGDVDDLLILYGVNIIFKGGRTAFNTIVGSTNYGIHWSDAWISTTTGTIIAHGQEPLISTADQCAVTSGSPLWNGLGGVTFPTVGDAVTWTMPYFALGITSFANIAPVLRGTNPTYCTFQFQYDLGAGWNGSWLTLDAATLAAVGSGIINPATGVKLKFLVTRSSGATTPIVTLITVYTVTDAVSQQIQYPLPFTSSGSVTNVVSGSRLQIMNMTTEEEIYNGVVSGTSYSYSYYNGTGVTAGDVIRVRLTNVAGVTAKSPFEQSTVATSTGWSVYAGQIDDVIYNAWAINGSTQSGFSADGTNIDIDVTAGSYTKKSLAAWWMYYLTTEAGIRTFWGAYTVVSAAEIRQEVDIVNVLLQNTDDGTAVIFTDNDIRYYRSDFSLPYDTSAGSGSVYMDYSGVPLVNLTGTALTAQQQAQLASAASNAGLIPALL